MREAVVALSVAYIFLDKSFGGPQFAAIIAAFTTPVAISSVPMAQEMGSDAKLAGQLVIFTMLFCAILIFLASFIFKLPGVF